jgi:formylglycine-generating enzyme required for sulfatase activity
MKNLKQDLLKITAVFLLPSLMAVSAQAAPRCEGVFLSLDPAKVEATIEDLAQFIFRLEIAKAENAHSLATKILAKEYPQKEFEVVRYLEDNHIMSKDELVVRIREIIARIQKQEKSEEDQRTTQTKIVINKFNWKKAVFNPIRPGEFKVGPDKVTVKITEPFEMMATPMTQAVWAYLNVRLGERNFQNSARFRSGEGSISEAVGLSVIVEMRPEYPMETVSWLEVRYLLDQLNKASQTGDRDMQSFLKNLMPGHEKGDVYDFPTEAQWEFVRTDRGQNYQEFFYGNDESIPTLLKFARFGGAEGPEPVGSREPWIIDGQPFYDLAGNVGVWMQGHDSTGRRAVRGGSWGSLPAELGLSNNRKLGIDNANASTGVRLVRTRK